MYVRMPKCTSQYMYNSTIHDVYICTCIYVYNYIRMSICKLVSTDRKLQCSAINTHVHVRYFSLECKVVSTTLTSSTPQESGTPQNVLHFFLSTYTIP